MSGVARSRVGARRRATAFGSLLLSLLALVSFAPAAGASTYVGGAVTIPEQGAGNPYPSSVQVNDLPGAVLNTRVALSRLSHPTPDEVDVLLVGPSGQATMLISDSCGSDPFDVTLTFDDASPTPLPGPSLPPPTCSTGTYKPTDHGGLLPESAELPPPAPADNDVASLSVFNGTNPNGIWSLFVADDVAAQGGALADGWRLELLPAASCGGRQATAADEVGTGRNDLITGTTGPDVLIGLGGTDRILGLGGDDVICGGVGDDVLEGGPGRDLLKGEAGNDLLKGEAGNDLLKGQGGRDVLKGQGGRDRCIGGKKRDVARSCERRKSI